jgi:hypothetical protein
VNRWTSQQLATASLVLAVAGWLIVMIGGIIVAGAAGAFSPTCCASRAPASIARWQALITAIGFAAIVIEMAAVAVVQYVHRRLRARHPRDRIASWMAYIFLAATALTLTQGIITHALRG